MKKNILPAAIAAIAGGMFSTLVHSQSLPFERTEEREPCSHFEQNRQPFYGDLHLHTGLSYDSSLRFVRPFPRDAYRFAKGEPVVRTNAIGMVEGTYEIERPLDFGAVTDHAEHFGEVGLCYDVGGINQPGKYSLDCQFITGFFYQPLLPPDTGTESPRILPAPLQRGLSAAFFLPISLQNDTAQHRASRLPVCNSGEGDCDHSELAVWDEMQQAAEEAYDRSSDCTFTSFVAYENSSTPGTVNWHRNVIFRNDMVIKRPVSAIDMAQVVPNTDPNTQRPIFTGNPGPEPKIMWDRLQSECLDADNGCDVLTIPHNPNLGGGIPGLADALFFDPRGDTPEERREYALQRQIFEPLVEMYQHKGASECRWDPRFNRGVGTNDELCDFELLETGSILDAAGIGGGLEGGNFTPPENFPSRAYVRNILKDGLAMKQSMGVNPFKLGFISSTDSHNATMGMTPESAWGPDFPTGFGGHLAIEDAAPTLAIQNSSGGHAGVWAEENSRDSIFEAMKRRETFGTTGTRIAPRFFGGYNFNRNVCSQSNLVQMGYQQGVPMGGDLNDAPGGGNGNRAATFIVQATYDDFIGTPLQQIQIIKGWVDAEGQTHEKVFTVAGNPNNGATVNPQTCDTVGSGFENLCARWEDPEWNPQQNAFYYARVLENPVCRFSTRWCMQEYGINPLSENCQDQLEDFAANNPQADQEAYGSCCSNESTGPRVQPVIQERAWTSPIWYSPDLAGNGNGNANGNSNGNANGNSNSNSNSNGNGG